MLKNGRWLAAVLGMLLATGCATNDEMLAERDRQLSEKEQENDRLKKQLADQRVTHGLMQRELEQRKSELARSQGERDDAWQQSQDLQRELALLRANAPSANDEQPAAVQDGPPLPTIEAGDGIEVETRNTGEVVLRLSDKVTFTPGSATLTSQGQRLVGEVADIISRHGEFDVSVEGHTDDTPLKRTKARWRTNENLSIARALAVQKYLAKKGSVPESRMRVVGYGSKRPLDAAKTDEARARNRRVEIVLYHRAD